MKKTAVKLGILWWIGIASGTIAQQSEKPLPAFISPDSIARQKTSRLKEQLQLTDKQYKKIYEMFRKEERKRLKKHTNRSQPPALDTDKRPCSPHPPFRHNPVIPPEKPGETRRHPRHDAPPLSPDIQETKKHRKKTIARIEKKIKKILTPEQFEKWKSIKPEAPEKESAPFLKE